MDFMINLLLLCGGICLGLLWLKTNIKTLLRGKRIPRVGEIWVGSSTSQDPWRSKHMCLIVGVKEGWVRYCYYNNTAKKFFDLDISDERKEIKVFVESFQFYVESVNHITEQN